MSIARIVMFKGVVDIIAKASGLITFPILARYAGADGYGAWGQLNTVVGLIIPFASLGLSGALVRFFADKRWVLDTRRRALQLNVVVGVAAALFAAGMALLAELLNDLFLKWADGVALFQWGSLLVMLGTLVQLQLDLLRARQRLFYFSLIQLFEALAMVAAAVILLPSGFGIVTLVKATALIKLSILVFVWIGMFSWDRPLSGPAATWNSSVGRMVAFGMPLVLSTVGVWMMNLGDRLVIGHFLAPDVVGLYSAASTFAGLIVAVNSPFLLPLYPRLVQSVATDDPRALLAEVELFHRYMSLALIPAAMYLMLIIPPLLELLGGSAFEVDLAVIIALVLALFMDQWNGIAHYILMSKDRVRLIRNAWLLAGLLNVLANILAVPWFGLRGAAIVTFATFAGLEVVFFVAANRMTGCSAAYRFRTSVKALASGVLGILATFLIFGRISPTVSSVLLATAVYLVVTIVMLATLREIGSTELRSIARALFMVRSS